jgi:hypothetical protein
MKNTLINPNQLKAHVIFVDDIPRHLAPTTARATHSIYIPKDNLRIQSTLQGIVSVFVFPTSSPAKANFLPVMKSGSLIVIHPDKRRKMHQSEGYC